MAGLGSGSYRFSGSVNNKKSYVYVKLTESAHKALEEYLKYRNICKNQPSIAFSGNEGEIKIPNQNHGGSTFKFQLQTQDSEGPQGSFESLRQVDQQCLDSLGPLMSIMRIQAKDDSYEKTRQSMANAMLQNGKTCVKELKTNGVINRHRPSRPNIVVPPHKKEPSHISSNPYSSQNGNTTSSTSPHRSSSGNKPQGWNAPLKPPHNGRKVNEALKKRPLRERIIQLLALKPMNKLQLMQRLHADGVKESDKRKVMSVVQGVATLKDNTYQLPKHMWSEVNEDWSFYTEDEKLLLKRNKPQNVSPQQREMAAAGHAPNSPISSSPSSVSGFPIVTKRPRLDPNYDPTMKKPRVSNVTQYADSVYRSDNSVISTSCTAVPSTTRSGYMSHGSPNEDSDVRNKIKLPQRDYQDPSDSQPRYTEKQLDPLSSYSQENLMNGHHSPSDASVSPLSQSSSPRNLSGSISKSFSISDNISKSDKKNKRNGTLNYDKEKESSINKHSVNNNNTQVMQNVESSLMPSSPDSQQENIYTLNYKEQYPRIEDSKQRRRYKADFNRIYAKYQDLHNDLEKTKLFFRDLDSSLNEQQYGSPEYNRIKNRILNEYNSRQLNFQEKKQRYHFLDEVLKHIKQHVSEYDAAHRF